MLGFGKASDHFCPSRSLMLLRAGPMQGTLGALPPPLVAVAALCSLIEEAGALVTAHHERPLAAARAALSAAHSGKAGWRLASRASLSICALITSLALYSARAATAAAAAVATVCAGGRLALRKRTGVVGRRTGVRDAAPLALGSGEPPPLLPPLLHFAPLLVRPALPPSPRPPTLAASISRAPVASLPRPTWQLSACNTTPTPAARACWQCAATPQLSLSRRRQHSRCWWSRTSGAAGLTRSLWIPAP